MICSDSLSCLLVIESCKTQNPLILKIVEIYKRLVAIGKHVIFIWIPSLIGIHGSTVVQRRIGWCYIQLFYFVCWLYTVYYVFYYVRYDIWLRLLVPSYFDRKNERGECISCNLLWIYWFQLSYQRFNICIT
jgi:hypothetical protein